MTENQIFISWENVERDEGVKMLNKNGESNIDKNVELGEGVDQIWSW